MATKLIPAVFALLAAGLAAGFLWLAAQASPVFGGPALAGLALGEYPSGVRVTGQHFACADGGPAALQASCALDLDGRPLRVELTYGDPDRVTITRCQAAYGDRQAACEAGRFTVQGPAFAQVRDPAVLGLTAADLQTLASRYPGSNWDEAGWTWTGFLAALSAAVLLGLAVAGWVVGDLRTRRFWITAGLSALAGFFALTIGLMTVLSGLALID